MPLKHEYRDLPAETSDLVWANREARSTMASAEKRSTETTKAAAAFLRDVTGLSLRDATHLLGISHQRLHQLVQSRGNAPRDEDPALNSAGFE